MNRRGLLATLGVFVLVVLAALLGSATGRMVTVLDLDVGDCMLLPAEGWDGEVSGIELMDCDDALYEAAGATEWVAARVEAVGSLIDGEDMPWPGEGESIALASQWCLRAASGREDVVPVAPDAATWSNEPRVVCLRLGR